MFLRFLSNKIVEMQNAYIYTLYKFKRWKLSTQYTHNVFTFLELESEKRFL